MRTIEIYFEAYHRSHTNLINITIHKICVPTIVFATLGILWAMPWPFMVFPGLNWASLTALVTLVYYLRLSWPLALGMAVVSFAMLVVIAMSYQFWWHSWMVMVAIFAASWAAQLVGHKIEGKRPSFLDDLHFLLMGPLWVLASFYRKMGISY